MIDDMALGVGAARSGTRVHAMVLNARLVGRALGIHDALGPATLVRVALVAGHAGARAGSVLLAAHGVVAAR